MFTYRSKQKGSPYRVTNSENRYVRIFNGLHWHYFQVQQAVRGTAPRCSRWVPLVTSSHPPRTTLHPHPWQQGCSYRKQSTLTYVPLLLQKYLWKNQLRKKSEHKIYLLVAGPDFKSTIGHLVFASITSFTLTLQIHCILDSPYCLPEDEKIFRTSQT